MRMFSVITIVSALCAMPLSQARSAGWTQFRSITELNQQPVAGSASEMVYVSLESGSNPSVCSSSNSFAFTLTNDRHKRMFAMLLAAKMAGSKVMLYTTGTCQVNTGDALLDGVVIE